MTDLITLRFRINDPADLYAAAVAAYGPDLETDEQGCNWLTNDDGTPNLERCLTEILCEQATGPASKIGDRADLWEPGD